MNIRRTVEWSIPVLSLVVIGLATAAWGDRLPDPMATHWGLGGRPDASLPVGVATGLAAGMAGLIGAGGLAVVSRAPDRKTARWTAAAAVGLSVLFLALHLWTIAANLDAPSWREADWLAGGDFGLVFVAGIFAGAVGYLLSGDRPDGPPQHLDTAPVDAADSELVVWSGRAAGHVIPVIAAATGLVGLSLVFLGPPEITLLGWTLVVSSPYLATFGVVRATVGPSGLRASLGLFSRPGYTLSLDDIESVEALTIEPLTVGGWGWRMLPGIRALVTRKGEGLKLVRRDAADLYVTVDGAATAAGVLQRHLDAHRARAG